ncbi:MAG TPA: AAA family ATPase [Anaerolineae bacterium]|nr:AAA family ATPase [Anaerolineae bacterium]
MTLYNRDSLGFVHIKRIELSDIRGLKRLDLDFTSPDGLRQKSVIIGRNGTGKTTILRSLAIALSPQSDASALLALSQASFIREGADVGSIRVDAVDLVDGSEFCVEVFVKGHGRSSFLDRNLSIGEPWRNFFVCGYGAGRSLTGVTSDEEYRQVDSVGSLFDYSRRLLNPEIILRRLYDYQDQRIFEPAMKGIRRILELRDDHRIEFRRGGGVQISGPGVGQIIPLDAWADGYRLTFSWILDLYGRAMQAGAITDNGGIRGVLLVDEIEQHLHPSMQSELINQLSAAMPELQIFATTHSPLTALGAGEENIISLQRDPATGQVHRMNVPSLKGYTVEDALVEDTLFGTDPYAQSTRDDLTRYRELTQKAPEELKPEEAADLEKLIVELDPSKLPGKAKDPIDQKLDEVLQLLKQQEGQR